MAETFPELQEKEIQIGDKVFLLTEMTGRKIFAFESYMKELQGCRQGDDDPDKKWDLYCKILKLILSEVTEEWLERQLSMDRLFKILDVQSELNRMDNIWGKVQSLLPMLNA